MGIRIVQLGKARAKDEGLRIGTVRRPPRGVAKENFAKLDYYDVWLPLLSPSVELMAEAKAATNASEWARFIRKFKSEISDGEGARVLDVLAALSQTSNLSVGCYCEDENHCHRSVLRTLLAERGAVFDA
jgi:uncharacterized protein YeaO (DUF488 family)